MSRDKPLSAGDIVSIRFSGVLRHYGVVTARGTVISNSQWHGGVVEQSFAAFSNGKRVRSHSRPSDTPDYVAESRARRALGSRYDLAGSNCIDLVRHAHRKRPSPWQRGKGVALTLRDMLR